MGTGVGEAMLIGAAVGAGTGAAGSMIAGGDPLKGALTGGAMGALGGGLGAGFGAAGGATAGGTSGATSGIGAGTTSGIGIGAGAGTGAGTGFGITAGMAPGATGAVGSSLYGAGTGALTGAGTGAATGATTAGIGAGTSMISPTTASLAGTTAGNFTGMAPQLSNTGLATIGGSSALSAAMQAERDRFKVPEEEDYKSSFDPTKFRASTPTYAPQSVYVPRYTDYSAKEGGIMKLAVGGVANGPVEQMSMDNQKFNYDPDLSPVTGPQSVGMNSGGIAEILQAAKNQGLTPEAYQNIYGRGNKIVEMEKALKSGAFTAAKGGIADLGGYSDGGRMLKGPGDGMSDSIPASIGGKQPARLADGEFVVPADVVSHLGNGSTDAGAKRLYGMMDKVRQARTGKTKQAKAINPKKYMPA